MSPFLHPTRCDFRIGVSGHRLPPKLPEESEAPLRALLDRLFAALSDAAPKAEFFVVSSLAEGADRIVAQAGLTAGFALEVVLPLGKAEYERDFETPASRKKFEELFDHASAVVELDGAAGARPRAYEAAGLYMLSKIDLLIAIWDGDVAAGTGGTAEIVDRAIADEICVVWIEPAKPDALQISWSDADVGQAATGTARPTPRFRTADVATVAQDVKHLFAPLTP
jgi:hypothetical protein